MVVLASAITTKTGKALISRQFVELTKARIEGLLAAFPKLMGTEKQHTFIETENIRYLYQPMESLYLLVITNKNSNILEDLDTLHLLAKIVPEYCTALSEDAVLKNAFEIIFAFDEAVAFGYKERVNIQQIKHFMAMESHDEEKAKMDEKVKVLEAKKSAEKQRKAIEKKKLEDRKMGISSAGFGGGSSGSSSSSYEPPRNYAKEPVVETKKEVPQERTIGKPGLQLKTKKTTGYSQVLKEENVKEQEVKGGSSVTLDNLSSSKVHVEISEKIILRAKNDGGLESMEVKGELILIVNDKNCTQVQVQVNQGPNKGFQFKAHPNMNKTSYTNDNILLLKDPSKAYPLATPSSILKWRYATTEESMMPLVINLWPSTSGGETTVPVEFEKKCDFDLSDVKISIPLPGASPVIGEVTGSCDYDHKNKMLHWKVPLIDSDNPNGTLEFNVPSASTSSFFPVHVSFNSKQTFCAIQVVGISGPENTPADFTATTMLSVEQYDIE